MRVMDPRYPRESTCAPMNPSLPIRRASGRITSAVTSPGACAAIGTLTPFSSTNVSPSLLPCKMLDSPMKSAANRLAGLPVDLLRSSDLLDSALVEDHDPVREGHRLFLIVGDEHESRADMALNQREFGLQPLAQFQIQGTERFIEQQHAGPVDQGAGDRDALSLSAGQLARPAGRRKFPGRPDRGLLGPGRVVHSWAPGPFSVRRTRSR